MSRTKILNFISCFLLCFSFSVSAQVWDNIQIEGGSGNEALKALEVSESGERIIAGTFVGSTTIGGENLAAAGEEDIFVSIIQENADAFSWRIGGEEEDNISGLAVTDDAIYLAGDFTLQSQFDSISLTTSLGAVGLFISRWNQQGEIQWVNVLDSDIFSISGDIAVDNEGAAYMCGYFFEELRIGEDTLYASSDEGDVFVAKWNAAGGLEWVTRAGESGIVRATGIVVNEDHEVIIAGEFRGDIIFGPDYIESNTQDHDIFVAKLNSEGDFLWGKKMGGVYEDDYGDLVLNEMGEIYLTGQFEGVLAVGDTTVQTQGFNRDIYLIHLDENGDAKWVKTYGGTDDDFATAIAYRPGQLALTGYFSGTTSYETWSWQASDGFDAFVVLMKEDATWLDAYQIHGDGFELGVDLAYLPNNECIAAGNFNENVAFQNQTFTTAGQYDFYLAETGILLQDENPNHLITSFGIYPNPAVGTVFFDIPYGKKANLWDVSGRFIQSIEGMKQLNGLLAGIYFVEMNGIVKKLVVQ